MSSPKKYIRSLYAAAETATIWFRSTAKSKTRKDWETHGGLDDEGTGAVYAFFGDQGSRLYVGQTKTSIKKRSLLQTSCHRNTNWWGKWKAVRFINVSDETDRFALELLLILGLLPKYNQKPKGRTKDDMLSNLTYRSTKSREIARN